MQDLINQLQQPIITYDNKGQMVTSAPTAIMLRAARKLTELNGIMQLLDRANIQLSQSNEQLTKYNETLQKELDDRRKAYPSAESVSDAGGGAEPLAHGQPPEPEGSDRDSKEPSAS